MGQIDERTVHRLRDGTSYVSSGLPGADMAAPHGLPQVGGNTPASAGAGTPMPVRGSDATTCATRTFNEGSAPGTAVQFPSLLPGFVPIDGGGQMSGNLLNATNLHAHGAGGAQVAGGDAERGGQDGSAQVLGKILAKLEQVQEQTAFLADQSHAYGIALQRLEAEQRRLAGISSRHGSALGLLAATPRSEKSGTSMNLGKEFPIGGTTCDGYSPYAVSPSERGGDDGTSSERSCASGRSGGPVTCLASTAANSKT